MSIQRNDLLAITTISDLDNLMSEVRAENENLLNSIDLLLKRYLAFGTEEKPKEFYTIREAAERLGVSKGTIRNWCINGIMKATQQQGAHTLWLIPATEIKRLLDDAGKY